jgi:hypothetical protein
MPSQARNPKVHTLARVLVEHAVTKDHFDGSPWPPEGDRWHLVGQLDDWRHEWRRITLVDAQRS